MKAPRAKPRPNMIWWLLPAVLFINLAALGLLIGYSSLNLRPYIPLHDRAQPLTMRQITYFMAPMLPTAASLLYLWPVFAWLRRVGTRNRNGAKVAPPSRVVEKAANAPLALAAFTLLTWVLVDVLLVLRLHAIFGQITFREPLLEGARRRHGASAGRGFYRARAGAEHRRDRQAGRRL